MLKKSGSRSLYLGDLFDFDAQDTPIEGRTAVFTDGKYETVDRFGKIRGWP